MKSKPDSTAPSSEDPAETIREQARRVRRSRRDGELEAELEAERQAELEATVPPESEEVAPSTEIEVDTEESPKQVRRRMRGSQWEKLKPKLISLLLTLIGGVAGTGGGVAYQSTRPPPSEVELQKVKEELEKEKAAREALAADLRDKIATNKTDSKDYYNDLRSLMFEQVNKPLNQRVNSLEAWQAEQVREQSSTARRVR